MIERIAISGYRSIRELVLRLGQLTVVTGVNGAGKSNLYRALRLLGDAARGTLAQSLATEGGFSSVLWAGPEEISQAMRDGSVPVQGTVRRKPISLKLAICADPFSYCVDLGLPVPMGSMFDRDPEVKREGIWAGPDLQARALCVDRRRETLRCRRGKGKWQDIDLGLTRNASVMSQFADPFNAPEVILMREQFCQWRFYDSFRCDQQAPARTVSAQTFTPVLSNNGSDLAAAIQTIIEIGDAEGLQVAIDQAFPGATLEVMRSGHGLQLLFNQPGMLRQLSASELSDGTLRYLLLIAALLSPRPPALLVLNEPESSLHPDLIRPLARMIQLASVSSQVIVVSHNDILLEELVKDSDDCCEVHLVKKLGETVIENQNLLDRYGFKWPSR